MGSVGSVYLAHDTLYHDKEVAVKIIHESLVNKSNLYHFKKEFEVMSRLKHPNLVKVFDFGRDYDQNQYYITMEYIKGDTIAQQFSPPTHLSFDKKRDYFVDMLRALAFIHSRNILHRDIKPANIIIEDHNVKLMDFGLSDLNEPEQKFKGTLYYIAPEQIHNKVDERSDIFSLGITFYEYFTDIPFFRELSTIEFLKLMHFEKFYHEYKETLLEKLEDKSLKKIINKMIAFNPAKRYTNTAQIIETINGTYNKTYPFETDETGEAYILGPAFVARDNELCILIDWRDNLPDYIAFIYGEAGIGKSRLLFEFKKHCQLNDILFMEGNFYENITRMFGPFLAILNECLLDVSTRLIDKYKLILKKLIPDNKRLLGIKKIEAIDPREERMNLINGIVNFLIDYVSEKKRLVIVYLNDLQWVDEASMSTLRLLNDRLRAADTPKPLLKIAVSSRVDNVETITGLRIKIKLGLFNRKNIFSYINSLFGKGNIGNGLTDSIPLINKKVGGNPFFLQEVIKLLVETRMITRKKKNWDLVTSIKDITIPSQIESLILGRIQRLSFTKEEERILQIMSLVGKELSRRDLNFIIKTDYNFLLRLEYFEIVISEIEENILFFRISHDLIIKSIVDKIEDRTALHGYIGNKLEMLYKDNIESYSEELAYHFQNSRKREKTMKYLGMAGDRAMRRFEYKKALGFYDSLLEILDVDDVKKHIDILLNKGKIFLELCSWEACETVLKEAVVLSDDIRDYHLHCEANYLLGRVYLHSEQIEKSIAAFEISLSHYKKTNNKSGIARVYNALGSSYRHMNNYESALSYYQRGYRIAKEVGDEENIAYNMGNLGVIAMEKGDYEYSIECNSVALAYSKKHKRKSRLAYGYGLIGRAYSNLQDYDRAMWYLDEAISIAIAIESPVLNANFYYFKADALYHLGKPDEALNYAIRSYELAVKTGVKFYSFFCQILSVKIYRDQGDVDKALDKLNHMMNKTDDEVDKAFIHYEIWCITKEETHKQAALSQFKKFYTTAPRIDFKNCIDHLSSDGTK